MTTKGSSTGATPTNEATKANENIPSTDKLSTYESSAGQPTTSEGQASEGHPTVKIGDYEIGDFERKWKEFQNRFDDALSGMLRGAFGIAGQPKLTEEERKAVLGGKGYVTCEEVTKRMLEGKYENIIIMAGAGISVSAGIPDFRSPDTGLYAKLAKEHNIDSPQSVFDIERFREDPTLFYSLRREIFKDGYQPTPAHYFVKLLWKKGLLKRLYTQNIDGLELATGLPSDVVINAHGTMSTSRCSDCEAQFETKDIRGQIMSGSVPKCPCGGVIRPNIVMFGEKLSDHFATSYKKDFPECDLLIIMGTSLSVHPFAGLVNEVPETTPRILINREAVGTPNLWYEMEEQNYRDVWYEGTCDQGCKDIAKMLQWHDELERLIEAGPAESSET